MTTADTIWFDILNALPCYIWSFFSELMLNKERSCSCRPADRNSTRCLPAVYCNLFCPRCYTTGALPAKPKEARSLSRWQVRSKKSRNVSAISSAVNTETQTINPDFKGHYWEGLVLPTSKQNPFYCRKFQREQSTARSLDYPLKTLRHCLEDDVSLLNLNNVRQTIPFMCLKRLKPKLHV